MHTVTILLSNFVYQYVFVFYYGVMDSFTMNDLMQMP